MVFASSKVAIRLVQRILALHHPRAGLVAELLDHLAVIAIVAIAVSPINPGLLSPVQKKSAGLLGAGASSSTNPESLIVYAKRGASRAAGARRRSPGPLAPRRQPPARVLGIDRLLHSRPAITASAMREANRRIARSASSLPGMTNHFVGIAVGVDDAEDRGF
jgi:hypothetical protein